ncbi:MAG: hypothetical protein HC831_18940 [Chloroflexia bacterium]|nr:hypothetical protein [Chloroflexia bacterium]
MKKQIASNEYFSVFVDESKNRVYATFNGFWSQMKIMDDYRACLPAVFKMMKSKFTLVADLRNFKTLPPDLVPKQKQSMMDFAQAGVFKIALILPSSAISGMQVKQSAAETKNMPERQFDNVAEAEKWLDSVVANL